MKDSTEAQDNMVVGFAWYHPELWQRVRDISAGAALGPSDLGAFHFGTQNC